MSKLSKPVKWGIGVVAVLVVLGVGGPFVYIHFIEGTPPAKLSLSSASTTTVKGSTATTEPATPASVDGTWTPTSASEAGYRVKEVLLGQSTTAVGRTNKVTGSMTISGTSLTAASFSVDMTSVTSDKSQRDSQFQGRIMDTADYPTATFVLSSPVDFGSVPAEGSTVSTTATGKLTLHGTTKEVTLTLKADRKGSNIEVNGSYNVVFADWNIDNPSFGPAQTGDNGTLEFLIVLAKS